MKSKLKLISGISLICLPFGIITYILHLQHKLFWAAQTLLMIFGIIGGIFGIVGLLYLGAKLIEDRNK